MTIPRPPTEAERRLAQYERLHAAALTMTQEQVDAAAYVMGGDPAWTAPGIARTLAPYLDAAIAEVQQEEAREARLAALYP